MSELDPKGVEAAGRAVMVSDGCGFTVEGKHVFCDDPTAPGNIRERTCGCRLNAEAAITAYLSTVSPLSDGDGWQPIESAPQAGVFLVVSPNGSGGWAVAMAYRAKNGTIRSETGASEMNFAEFWWALPAPPRDEVA